MAHRKTCRRFAICACAAFAACCGAGSWADNPAEKRIREELAKPTSAEFNEQPLSGVVDYFKDMHGINIRINDTRLKEANVAMDLPVTCSAKGISLRSALNLILGDIGVTYIIENEVLVITTAEQAQRISIPRAHDATGLAAPADREALLEAVELVLDPPAKGATGKGVALESRVRIFRDKLLLRGSQPEHDRVAELLLRLREAPPAAVEPVRLPLAGEATTKSGRATR